MRTSGKTFLTASQETTNFSQLFELWDVIISVSASQQGSQHHLEAFEELIAAGLSSRFPSIANRTISAWNAAYGPSDELQYPPKIAKALRKLQAADIDITVTSRLPPASDEVLAPK